MAARLLVPSDPNSVSIGRDARRNTNRERKKCRENGRGTENPEIRTAIADAEHRVCNITLSNSNRTGGKFKDGTYTASLNFFSLAEAKGHALNQTTDIIAFQSSLGTTEGNGEKKAKKRRERSRTMCASRFRDGLETSPSSSKLATKASSRFELLHDTQRPCETFIHY